MNQTNAIKLSSARAWRTYLGGKLLDELYGASQAKDSHFPEEWMMSVVCARNAGREAFMTEGLSMVEGTLPQLSLKELIARNSANMLGQQHVTAFGNTTGVLVKLIDAAERLTVQVHPDRPTARRLFQSPFGKTECWHILGGRTINGQAPSIYLGFKPGITRQYWQELFNNQDISGMLSCLHHFDVQPGDTFIIEGGIPHAIGAGCFLVEIQEPTDFTIRVEKTTPSGFEVADAMCHQGLGFETMFDCFSYHGLTFEETSRRWKVEPELTVNHPGGQERELIGYKHTNYFRLTEISLHTTLPLPTNDIFSGLYILSGQGTLSSDEQQQAFKTGDQFFIPAQSKSLSLQNTGTTPCKILRYFGPNPANA